MNSNIAIITARGGSKRIPKKNIKDFCGQPILNYSIKAAIDTGIFNEVMVSTDSEEIKEIAIAAGAHVPFLRSEATSNDYATTAEVLREVLVGYDAIYLKYDIMACIYPTAPFVTAEKLKKAYNTLINSEATSVMPVVQYSFPPQRANVIRDGLLVYEFQENRLKRSQDLEPIYHDAGQFYFYKVNSDLSFTADKYAPIFVDDLEVQDIDNESDWKIAEMKYKLMLENKIQR